MAQALAELQLTEAEAVGRRQVEQLEAAEGTTHRLALEGQLQATGAQQFAEAMLALEKADHPGLSWHPCSCFLSLSMLCGPLCSMLCLGRGTGGQAVSIPGRPS